jgi:hypothetical protein
LAAFAALPLGGRAGEYHYALRDGGFWIHNGPAYFNRPLFGTHEPSMLLSGGRPAFAYFAPTDVGKIGDLYLGLITARGGKWVDHFSQIDSVYQPGLTRHIVQDPDVLSGSLEVTAVPLASLEGFAVQLRWIQAPTEPVRLVWVFGGASGYDDFKRFAIDKLRLSGSDAEGNVVHLWGNNFSITSAAIKRKELWGTCDLPGRWALKDAGAVLPGPLEAERAASSKAPVVVFSGDWPREKSSVHLLFTLAGAENLAALAADAGSTFQESVRFYRTMAQRVQVHTPDPHFDLAVESMVIANDGMWRPPSFVHGAMSWMQHYLGWRIWYGPEAYGWHDRVLTSILAFAKLQIQSGESRGAIPHMLEQPGAVFYNMDEVYLDHIYYHYLWTGDRSLLASLFPVIQGVLSWEKRRLDPDDNALYENCLNTWISDSHWYSGGDCSQASAYMFRGYQLGAEAAEAAGENPEPYRRETERIRTAMNDRLWLSSQGHYAEFIDHLGLKRIHSEPELPTIYHPIDFGVTDQFQAYQMLRFTETSLRNETGIPRGGRLAWSSNWAPNYDRHYTHSTYDLVFAESLNLAIAYYRAGQYDKAYELVKGVYASLYQGGIPGGLSCHAYANGQQRANEEFADSISMFARTAVEGVFGIVPEMQRGVIHISPGFPHEWKDASISTPDLSYQFHKTDSEITLQVSTPQPVRIHYRVALFDARATGVFVDGQAAQVRVEPGIGESFVEVTSPSGRESHLRIEYKPSPARVTYPTVVFPGEHFTLDVDGAPFRPPRDPQKVLELGGSSGQSLRGTITGTLGHHTFFLPVGGAQDARWEPVNVEIRPALEILNPRADFQSGKCTFALRNNTDIAITARAKALWTGQSAPLDMNVAAGKEQVLSVEGKAEGLLLGKNPLEITGLANAPKLQAEVLYWPPTAPPAIDKTPWQLLRLDAQYNDQVSTALYHHFWTTEYPYAVCFDYMLAHLNGDRRSPPNDLLLRSKVNAQGVFVTQVGIPFAQRAEGNNIVALSRTWRNFPDHLTVPVRSRARKIYFLISGITFPMQSQIANAQIMVRYADGKEDKLDLVNPENFDNSWGGFGGSYHYASNGMEVIGSALPGEVDFMARAMPVARQAILLGQQGVPEVIDYAKWATPAHADIIDVNCDPTREIRSAEITVFSNEIIVAVHGITVMKP